MTQTPNGEELILGNYKIGGYWLIQAKLQAKEPLEK